MNLEPIGWYSSWTTGVQYLPGKGPEDLQRYGFVVVEEDENEDDDDC